MFQVSCLLRSVPHAALRRKRAGMSINLRSSRVFESGFLSQGWAVHVVSLVRVDVSRTRCAKDVDAWMSSGEFAFFRIHTSIGMPACGPTTFSFTLYLKHTHQHPAYSYIASVFNPHAARASRYVSVPVRGWRQPVESLHAFMWCYDGIYVCSDN